MGKTVVQSSTFENGNPENAIDGNLIQAFGYGLNQRCTHTDVGEYIRTYNEII